MPNSKDVFKWIVEQISLDENTDEINSIAYMLMDHLFTKSKSQVLANASLPEFDQKIIESLVLRINSSEPIQYITGLQDFYGRSFNVSPAVLIPRPETELLITVAKAFARNKIEQPLSLLDIGTGSGCIPITLSLESKNIQASGLDISMEAISVAEENNRKHFTNVKFWVSDILRDKLPDKKFDIITSNPPYVTENEKSTMKSNVLNFEPSHALFVPNEDSLIFYHAIIDKSKAHLTDGGLLAVEINEEFGNEVAAVFDQHKYHSIEILKDYSDKNRIVKAFYGRGHH